MEIRLSLKLTCRQRSRTEAIIIFVFLDFGREIENETPAVPCENVAYIYPHSLFYLKKHVLNCGLGYGPSLILMGLRLSPRE